MEYCSRCDRDFTSYSAIERHRRDSSHHNICYDCNLDFSSFLGLKEHWVQSPHHAYCQYCDEHMGGDGELEDHYAAAHYYCDGCRKFFKSEYGLEEHYRQSPLHHYCVPCKRNFQSASNLRSHLNSSIHQQRDYACPSGCGQTFISRSAVILHLEGGSCRSGANRSTVNRFVRELDHNNVITNPSRMITGGEETIYYASEASWNGSTYECYLCHGGYRTLRALNQHLASPRHQEKMYFCPLDTCRVRFTTLSALCQHIESERCGIARFKMVQNTLNGIMSGMKRLTM